MRKAFGIIIIIFVCLYCISPIDAAPGPIDDFLVAIFGMLTTAKLNYKDCD